MKISLAIINDNEALYLQRFFESLGSWRDLLDIVFVDNCSCDNSIQIVKDLGIGKIVTFDKKKVSRPVLYNAAASRTEGDYVLFTHSDIIFGDSFFKNLEKGLKERTDLDFMNFRVMYVDKTTIAPSIVYREFENKRIKLSYHSIWSISDPALKKIISCSESCFLVDSTVFKHEHFDERYFDTFFIEDLLLKLDLQGANIVYDGDSYIEHYFLEEHERLRTLKYDIRLFTKNNLKELQVVNLAEQDRQISSLETNLQEKVAQIESLKYQIESLEYQIESLESQIYQIQRNIPMQLVNRYQRIVERLLRPGTRRRRYYELGLSGIRGILNEGGRSFWFKFRQRLSQLCTGEMSTFFPNLYRIKPMIQPVSTTRTTVPQDASKDMVCVDIVTVTYNSGRFIKDLITSIQALDYPVELLSLTVIDNCSTDDTLDILASIVPAHSFKQFQAIRANRNLGYGKGVNEAAKMGSAPYIFVVNPDVKLMQSCLTVLVEKALHDTEAWLWEPRQFPYEHPKFYDPVSLETLWSSGAAFLVRRDKFEEVGGFDESLFLYADDVDLSLRIWNYGGKCRYVPCATLWHFTYSEPGEVKPLQWYYSIRNNLLIRYKFGRVSEIIKGYLLLTGGFLKGNAAIHHARLRLLNLFFTHLKLVPSMVSWRLRNRKPFFNQYSFLGWDYEVRRLGAFYENRPSTEKPLVTVLIRTKERPSYLRDALRSVANQTYRPIEVVVVEDGPATSEAVIDEFVGASSLAVKYHPLGVSRGRCFAGNEALRLASGRFLNFLDDDDLLYPDHVESLVQALLSHNLQYKAAYSASFMVKASYTTEAILPHEFNSFFNPYRKDELKTTNLFPIQAVMFYRDLYDSLGGLDKGAEGLEDWDIWLKYAKATDFLAVEKTTSEFRIPKDPTSISERQSSLDRLYWFVRKRHELL